MVAYSLGNALFDQHFPETLRRSMLLSVRLNAVGVLEAWTIPYQVDARNGRVLPPQDGMSAVIR